VRSDAFGLLNESRGTRLQLSMKEGKQISKGRPGLYSVSAVAILALAPLNTAWAQETTYEVRGYGVNEASVIDKAGDMTTASSQTRGNADLTRPGMPAVKFTYECRAVSHFSKAGAEFTNRCTFVDPDGDRLVGASNGTQKGWQWRYLGGTGKWEGITGGGPGVPDGAYARVSSSVAGSCCKATGTYTLKK
jgi:hypothetical protein